LLGLACAAPFDDQPWLVTAPRLLAITVEPPEAPPGARVTLTAVVADPGGAVVDAGLRWARCDLPRAFSANQAVNPECLAVVTAAPRSGLATELALPPDDCSRFGPDAPSAGVRPRDPDATGGYFHPVGVALDGDAVAFAFVRLACRPAGVPFDVAQAYAAAARPNTSPRVTVRASVAGAAADLEALPAGAEVALAADWSATPEETFPLLDPLTRELTFAVEVYDVAWFVTDGRLDRARGASGTDLWRLPLEPGQAWLWVVVRDSRGGVGVTLARARWR
jgi:hypothetical protein